MANRVLLIEDEPIFTLVIGDLLAAAGFDVTTAAEASQAWSLLHRNPFAYDVILLDRGLPDMDGMELLRRIRADKAFDHIPVIIETAQCDDQSIQEGLENGAYYYLTKPFQSGVLLAVVNAALQQYREWRDLSDGLRQAESLLTLLERGSFRFRDLDQARLLANNLARVCPQPERAVHGLLELLINAVEHGNLAISYADKSELLMKGLWQQEISRRLALPEFNRRYVEVTFERRSDCLEFTITDCGDGFDWQDYLEFSPARAFDLHGRGIAMACKLSIDRLQYQGNGNTVVARFNLADAESAA